MARVFLVKEDGSRIPLPDGTTILGRGVLLGIDDKKCSRRQAEITNESGPVITFISHGVNPSQLQRQGATETTPMVTGTEYALHHGDVIYLVGNLYKFTIDVPSQAKAAPAPSAVGLKHKRSTIDSDYEVEEHDETKPTPAATTATKKQPKKPTAANLPPCPYGASCYRNNPTHFQEFSHPPGHPSNPADVSTNSAVNKVSSHTTAPEPPTKKRKTSKTSAPTPASAITPPTASWSRDQAHYALAFPSFSTSTFQFDTAKAAATAIPVISRFLRTHTDPRIRLVLVDQDPAVLAAFRSEAERAGLIHKPPTDDRLMLFAGDITQLAVAGIPCATIANSSNRFFSAAGSGVNAAVHNAVPTLAAATLAAGHRPPARVGVPYVVPLSTPSTSTTAIDCVIHIVGPNMNPNRPNWLRGDYATGCRQLAQCYEGLLKAWYARTGLPPVDEDDMSDGGGVDVVDTKAATSEETSAEANAELHYVVPTETTLARRSSAMAAALPTNAATAVHGGDSGSEKPKTATAHFSNWANALDDYVLHPERHADLLYHKDDEVVIIKDKYPKARVHLLVMPTTLIAGYVSLNRSHVAMLRALKAKGEWAAAREKAKLGEGVAVRLGFHAVPSMRQLHMHVISQDFDSPALKNKKHWNSFTSAFFIDPDEVIAMLENTGAVKFDVVRYQNILSGPLKCPRCKRELATIPQAKEHVRGCRRV